MSRHISKRDQQENVYDSDAEMEEEEEKNRKSQILKECFNLEDFLEFQETKEILEDDFGENFEKECVPQLKSFWEKQVDMCREKDSTLFKHEVDHSHFDTFLDTVFEYLVPNYNLELFYESPDLADNMVRTYTEREKIYNEQRLADIRENYKKSSINANKSFDWTTKTYKK